MNTNLRSGVFVFGGLVFGVEVGGGGGGGDITEALIRPVLLAKVGYW